ncbi:MAG: hypothetical protein M3O36_07685 [Myxococcota bacterium]|nr:hypothetical protein [Myxococcota bacterium]
MRLHLAAVRFLSMYVGATVTTTACSSLFNLDQYTAPSARDAMTATSSAGEPDASGGDAALEDAVSVEGAVPAEGASAECATNAECTAQATADGPLDGGAFEGGQASLTDAAPFTGMLAGGIIPAVCVGASHKCSRLLTPDCPTLYGNYLNDDAILLGTLFTTSGTLATSNVSRQQAALLAAEEINSAGAGGGLPPLSAQGPPRPLVVLECDPSQNAVRTAMHLVNDLHVPAIVGPSQAQDVIDITQQVSAKGGTLLISPTAPASPITYLVDNGLTWRDVPSDDQRSKLVIEQINEIETMLHVARGSMLKLGVVYRTDALGTSALQSISGKLNFNGHFLSDAANTTKVSLDHYDAANNVAAQTDIASHYASFVPDIVFVTAQEQIADIVLPLERALAAANAPNRPYYICSDVAKVQALSAGVGAAGVPADFASRVRGIGIRPDPDSVPVFASFGTAFTSRYGANPRTSGMGSSYDAMYAIAYAIASVPSTTVTGATIAQGLSSLGGGVAVSVGQGQANLALQTLAAGKPIALRGTFSAMVWDAHGDIVGGTAEVWCIGTSGGTAAFASSGLTMDIATQVLSGTYVQCK